jgi:hypothetical protein
MEIFEQAELVMTAITGTRLAISNYTIDTTIMASTLGDSYKHVFSAGY